ncbi:hypothetical protein PC115_g15192 [Phytophthora cactorum]|uniref:HTH CENPB-type domain-containing protein n=1 Tax=Phytophthora cactorum TaxID=29920 RepID=A0A8T1BKG6_9STRA|nr:hypothetical protein PC115_g15192 [Phytophthora cactorum]
MPRQPKHVGNLTFQQKKKICEWSAARPHPTQRELALKAQRELALLKPPTQGTICNILKRMETFLRATDAQLQRRRTATLAQPAVDDALANWVHQYQARRISLSGDLLKEKARRIEELLDTPKDLCLRFSNGWLQAFQARHGFKSLKMHEESTEMEVLSAEDLLSDVCDAALVGSAQYASDDETDEEEAPINPLDALTATDRVNAIRSVIYILSEHPDVDLKTMEGLRTLQQRAREQLRVERESALTQTSIRGFFSVV